MELKAQQNYDQFLQATLLQPPGWLPGEPVVWWQVAGQAQQEKMERAAAAAAAAAAGNPEVHGPVLPVP